MADLQSILQNAAIPQGVRADAWDAYNSASNEDDLAGRLNKLPLPKSVKADLWDLKHSSVNAPVPAAISPAEMAQRQAASKAAADANAPSLIGGFASEALKNAKRVGSLIMDSTEGGTTTTSQGQTLPVLTGQESTGHPVLDVANAVMAAGSPNTIIPSGARAAQNFQAAMDAAKDIPIDTSKVADIVDRAKQLKATGSTMPKVMSDTARLLDKPLATTLENEPYIPYSQGRDLASSAGRLSASERLATNRQMEAQVAKLAGALKDANRGAAVTAGVADQYDQAIKEYRALMQIKDAGKFTMKYIIPSLAGGGLATAIARHYLAPAP